MKKDLTYLNKWQLFFMKNDGEQNRSVIVDTFADYLAGFSMDPFEIPGDCIIGGYVYGKKGCVDGAQMFTPRITFVRRINISMKNGVRDDLMCADTEYGNQYYFFADEPNGYMQQMLGDSTHAGAISEEEGFYLDPALRVKHPEFL